MDEAAGLVLMNVKASENDVESCLTVSVVETYVFVYSKAKVAYRTYR